MPRQGQSVESCIINKWYKQKGEKVAVGDILFSYETDKASFEEEAKAEGVLLDVFFGEGDEVECLKTVCVIGGEGESTADFVRVSPRARALAAKTGADASCAVPTGANDRIMEKDIRKAISEGYARTKQGDGSPASPAESVPSLESASLPEYVPPMEYVSHTESVPSLESDSPPEYEDVPLSNVRKVTAKTMHASLADSAQLTNHSSFDATDILNFRKTLKSIEGREDLAKITITDIIVYSASRVLLKHRNLNAHFQGHVMRLWNNANIGVAVDTPRGLLVPTVFNANKMTLTELSARSKELIDKCKQKTITPDQLTGGSFTVSNLGGFGVEMFTPILNPPQTGLLGVCCIIERTRNGVPYSAMGLSLTYDHRAVDGADAARFQKDLIVYLENFTINLLIEGAI